MSPRSQDSSCRRRRPGPVRAAAGLGRCGRAGDTGAAWPSRCRRMAAGLSGDQRQIADYWKRCSSVGRTISSVLLGTSILDQTTAPLSHACSAYDDAAGSLEELAHSNAFVVSLDDHREWYRSTICSVISSVRTSTWPPGAAPRLLAAGSGLVRAPAIAWRCVRLRAGGRRSRSRRPNRASSRDDLPAAGRSRASGSGSTAAPRRRRADPRLSIAAASVFGYPRRCCPGKAVLGRGRARPLASQPPTALRFARRSPVWKCHGSDGIPRMLRTPRSDTRMRRRWAPSVRSAPVAPWVGVPSPGPTAGGNRRAPEVTSAFKGPTRSPTLGSRARLSGLRGRRTGDRRDARRSAVEADWLAAQQHLHETIYGGIAPRQGARHNNAAIQTEAARQLETSGGSARCSARPMADADLALRCADISLDLAKWPAPSNTRRSPATHYRIPMPERFRPGSSASKRGQAGQDYGSHLRSSGSSLSCGRISRSKRSPIAPPRTPHGQDTCPSIYVNGVTGRSDAVEVIEQAGLESIEVEVTIPGPDRDSRRDAGSPWANGSGGAVGFVRG